jgi:hypothetical protein
MSDYKVSLLAGIINNIRFVGLEVSATEKVGFTALPENSSCSSSEHDRQEVLEITNSPTFIT